MREAGVELAGEMMEVRRQDQRRGRQRGARALCERPHFGGPSAAPAARKTGPTHEVFLLSHHHSRTPGQPVRQQGAQDHRYKRSALRCVDTASGQADRLAVARACAEPPAGVFASGHA